MARLYIAVRRIAGARLYLDDSTGLVLRDLEARAWWLKTQHLDLTLLVVDYLQLVTASVKVAVPAGGRPAASRSSPISPESGAIDDRNRGMRRP